MKIDVEGFERLVLLGAQRLIETYWPIIVIEQNDVVLHNDEKFSALRHLEGLGYEVVATCPRGWDFILRK